MKNTNVKGLANVKGFKMSVKMSIDSCEINSNRHFIGNKDYDGSKRTIKGFDFEIAMEADAAEIELQGLHEEIKEALKQELKKAAK